MRWFPLSEDSSVSRAVVSASDVVAIAFGIAGEHAEGITLAVSTAAVMIFFPVFFVEVEIEECRFMSDVNRSAERIDGIIHILIAVLAGIELHGAASQNFGIMPT